MTLALMPQENQNVIILNLVLEPAINTPVKLSVANKGGKVNNYLQLFAVFRRVRFMPKWFRSRKRSRSLAVILEWLKDEMSTTITDEEALMLLGVKFRNSLKPDDDLEIEGVGEDDG